MLYARGDDDGGRLTPLQPAGERAGEFSELLQLLREHRRDDSAATAAVVQTMVAACAGDRHLWEDMQLPDRAALSELIRRHFPTLYHRNTANMRWKKFFYRQLCDRAAARLCRAPSCGACSDYASCFGAE
jgi:nitrogen fixation protein NifQ